MSTPRSSLPEGSSLVRECIDKQTGTNKTCCPRPTPFLGLLQLASHRNNVGRYRYRQLAQPGLFVSPSRLSSPKTFHRNTKSLPNGALTSPSWSSVSRVAHLWPAAHALTFAQVNLVWGKPRSLTPCFPPSCLPRRTTTAVTSSNSTS